MSYATEADLDATWGKALVDLVTIDDTTLLRDGVKISAALEQASAAINSYVSRRYAMPLQLTPDGVILLRGCCADIAMFNLATSADRMSDIIQKRHDRAIALLKDVQAGKADVATTADQADTDPISPNEAVLESDGRVFSRKTLRDM